MILRSFLRALAQLGDRRFRRVVWLGVALALALLVGVYGATLLAITNLTPDTADLPRLGTVEGLHELLGVTSFFVMIGASVFLMVPVAAAFSGLFLEDVVAAVEARHYPHLPPVPRPRLMDGIIDSANFVGLIVAVNVVALVLMFLLPLAGLFMPVIFWAVNGLLLGREYATLVAMRRLGREGARDLRSRNFWRIWAAGMLMAVPLSVPLVNLLIPVLGVATFTHLVQAMARADGAPLPR
jgi:uncharacterized protein involved in cysteine biosynthesis